MSRAVASTTVTTIVIRVWRGKHLGAISERSGNEEVDEWCEVGWCWREKGDKVGEKRWFCCSRIEEMKKKGGKGREDDGMAKMYEVANGKERENLDFLNNLEVLLFKCKKKVYMW
jgi:hypothetical protein